MKKILLTLFLLPTIVFCQIRDLVTVKTSIYEIVYSEVKESPILIKYKVQCPTGTASRVGMDFYPNDTIHTSDNLDYLDNVYDKGHMAPAADFNCTKEMLKVTFSYLNCALQNQYLNRGVWRMLEVQEREWAKTDVVNVTIEVKFDKTSEKLKTGATVPLGFYKTIELVSKKQVHRYYFPNQKPTKLKFIEYEVF